MKKPKKNRQGEDGEESKRGLEEFSARLRGARLKSGLTQQQVADAIGLASYISYQHWERGKRWPSSEYLAPLCRLLKLTADDLLGLGQPQQ
jgi:transcriptional regulator with XRE-family HTH domain